METSNLFVVSKRMRRLFCRPEQTRGSKHCGPVQITGSVHVLPTWGWSNELPAAYVLMTTTMDPLQLSL